MDTDCLGDVTSIYRKVFSRAFRSHWNHENRWRIDGDMAEWSLWHYPFSWFELHWEVILIVVYSEDIPAAFHLHFVNSPQVPMCRLLKYILSIWQGIHSSHAFVISPEFFLPPILPGPCIKVGGGGVAFWPQMVDSEYWVNLLAWKTGCSAR